MSAFFRSCFAPHRLSGGICVVDLVRSWARHHTPAEVATAAGQIDTMLAAGVSDDALRVWVLGAAGCGYDPGMQGMGMGQWLAMVRDLLLGQSDWALPPGAWEALGPWPQPEVGSLEVLRHLLTGYFHKDWKRHHATFEAVVERFVTDEGPVRASGLVDDVDELLGLECGEERLRILVLGRFRSSYDPRPDLPGGHTMEQWLRSVRGVALSSALAG